MPCTIVENLSNKKLGILVAILLSCQLACFLVGFISPSPATSQGILATVCVDDKPELMNDTKRWFARNCSRKVNLEHPDSTKNLDTYNLVFAFEVPYANLDFSRWQQNLVGILQIDVIYGGQKVQDGVIELIVDSRLAYSNKSPNGKKTPWQLYAYDKEKRYMECTSEETAVEDKRKYGYPYNCSMVPLFELGSLYHAYYLLNVRLVYDAVLDRNTKLDRVTDIYLHIIHMNGVFTKICVSLKTVFFPIIIAILVWFWRRVYMLSREPALLECLLFSLGFSLALLDLPVEYLTLHFDMPYMLLLNDIRQGIFYSTLLCFWLVFAGEHMLVQDNGKENSIKLYWKHLTAIVIGCLSLSVFDLCEHGVQLVNPFYSIWVAPISANLALWFMNLTGISAGIYFIFLCYMLWQVFKNIRVHRSVLPSMFHDFHLRRLHCEGIIYRFNFLMMATVICAALTIIFFILNQVAESQNKWNENMQIDLVSVFRTGVYGMWNVYICLMLILYAPSHKQWRAEQTGVEVEGVELSRLPQSTDLKEISSLT